MSDQINVLNNKYLESNTDVAMGVVQSEQTSAMVTPYIITKASIQSFGSLQDVPSDGNCFLYPIGKHYVKKEDMTMYWISTVIGKTSILMHVKNGRRYCHQYTTVRIT